MLTPTPKSVSGATVFTTTQWSVVLTAATGIVSPEADAALEGLCRNYWYPLYTFIRRRGYDIHEAQDLTQEFFSRLLQKNYLNAIDRNKGKFRSFLLAALDHFLANQFRHAHAQKRGGKVQFISFSDPFEEPCYQAVSAGIPAEKLFEQQWAVRLLEQSIEKLRKEFAADGKADLLEHLKVFLTGEKRPVSYGELSKKLGTSEAALKMTVSRMRRRYGELLRAEIANTVASEQDVEDELRCLFAAFN